MTATKKKGLGWYIVSLFTCPCHYFLVIPLLAGTAAGAFFSKHIIATITIMSLLFLYTLYMGWKKTNQSKGAKAS